MNILTVGSKKEFRAHIFKQFFKLLQDTRIFFRGPFAVPSLAAFLGVFGLVYQTQ